MSYIRSQSAQRAKSYRPRKASVAAVSAAGVISEDILKLIWQPRFRSDPRVDLPPRCLVWSKPDYFHYLRGWIPHLKYSGDLLHTPEATRCFSDIQDVFTMLKSREERRRRIEHLDSDNTIDTNDTSTQHAVFQMQTHELKSKLDNELFEDALEYWTNTIARTFPSPELSLELDRLYPLAINDPKASDVISMDTIEISWAPKVTLDILASLVPPHTAETDLSYMSRQSWQDEPLHTQWSDFIQFWIPVMNSPLCLVLLPQLVCHVAQVHSRHTAFALFCYLNRQRLGNKLRYSRQLSMMYNRSINCGMNALIAYLCPVPRAQNQRQGPVVSTQQLIKESDDTANSDMIYNVIDKTRVEPPVLKIFPHVVQKVFPEIPKYYLQEFYALILAKRLRVTGPHYRYLIDQLLVNGTDAEKSLIMNTDRMMHLKYEEGKRKLLENQDPSDSSPAEIDEAGNNIIPTFDLRVYGQILKLAYKTKNEELATFIKDKVLVNYAATNPIKLKQVVETALRVSIDQGRIQDISSVYEYLSKLPEFKPSERMYASFFRGFRKATGTVLESEARCFEILDMIHSHGWNIPAYLCTEVLLLINEKYHALTVYDFYQAYFGSQHLVDNDLGIDTYFEEIAIQPGLSRPPHIPSVMPPSAYETSPAPPTQYGFNPIALSILYSCILQTVEHIQQLHFLYSKFRLSPLYTNPEVYISVIDSFVRALTTRFQTKEATSLARAIVEDMVYNNASFMRYDRALAPGTFGEAEEALSEEEQSSLLQSVLQDPITKQQTIVDGVPPPKTNVPSRLPARYAGLKFQCFGLLINQYCETGQINAAKEILQLACLNSPVIYGQMFEPIVEYYILKNNIDMARKWYDSANGLGAYITDKTLLDALDIKPHIM